MEDISIRLITENKKAYLPLLLLGDEQESQIDKYLERGDLFALYAGDVKSVCVVTDEGGGILEIQNLATDTRYQQQGYASRLIDYVAGYYTGQYDRIILGTGDVPGILAFYNHRGFKETHRVADYFSTHYDHSIIEDGVLLKDKVYLERKLSDLTQNIGKIHTTLMGAERIKRNLNLQTDDVAEWCKNAARKADIIIGQGKNWYVYRDGVVITINAHSYTVITAHKINAKVRVMRKSDYECLPEFLYQAIFVPESADPPPRSVINDPEVFVYIDDFGTQAGDLGVVAEQNGQIVGAAWTRIIPAYGHIDSETPELAISIFPEFRGYGIGTKLMKKLSTVLRENGYKQTSLSVQKDNPAVRFYQRLGYEMSGERIDHAGHEDYLMIKYL